MRKRHCAHVFFVLLVLGLSLMVPAEDQAETVFDESEAQPCASAELFSMAALATVAELSSLRPRASVLPVGSLRSLGAQRLDHQPGRTHPMCDSLTILDHSLRC